MNMKKAIALSLAIMILVAASVAGTIAWLQDTTQVVTNTFTTSNIDITLSETDSDDADNDANNNAYKMVPGNAGAEGVYYREVAASNADQPFPVLTNNQVVVKDGVTNQMMDAAETSVPTLTFQAYAIQKANFNTVEGAWTEAQTLTTPYTPST